MDYGKLFNVDRVDFRLPAPPASQDARSIRVLRAAQASSPPAPPAVRVGCPIWAQRKWIGKVYPLDAKPADFLRHYSRQFGTIELNVTHYRIPTPEAVIEWRDQTPPGFRFCPKWPQEISHHRGLQDCEELTALFCDSLSRLGDRLGTSFLQLPPGFAPRQLPTLKRFLQGVPRDFPVCVEFREPGWFADHALIPEALDALEELGAGTVITEVAGRRDAAHVSLTLPRTLIRFVGNSLHPSDYERVDAWIPRLKLWLDNGIRELDICVHQTDNVLEPEFAKYFVERLNEGAGLKLPTWTPMDRGTQMNLL
jgi:uncharacterized protein YecE (DUF72 family)